MTTLIILFLSAFASTAFAAGPSAGSLTELTPDTATILTAVSAVAIALVTIHLAIFGFKTVRYIIDERENDREALEELREKWDRHD